MNIVKTAFKDLLIIKHDIFHDNRGSFKEIFRKNIIEESLGYRINFCQENSVKSCKNVLRGLHYQKKPFAQSKLISISSGKIFDVAVDIRKDSKTYGNFFSRVLDANNNESIFIPKGFAHGYLTLSDFASISYKVDNYYNPNVEEGIVFNDDFLKIDWGIEEAKLIISKKDLGFNNYNW